MTSIVESMVTAVARDLTNLLNGKNTSSTLARDALKHAMHSSHLTDGILKGTVCRAMIFLAGYGLYITLATDRTVGRILDALHASQGSRFLTMAAPYSPRNDKIGRSFCRVGKIANGTRRLVTALRDARVPRREWHSSNILRHSQSWTGVGNRRMSNAMATANTQSTQDATGSKNLSAPLRRHHPTGRLAS